MKQRDPKGLIRLALEIGAIQFRDKGFELKSGRISPYFFNIGAFCTGSAMQRLVSEIAEIVGNELRHPACILYGPPYKGTILVPAVSMLLCQTKRLAQIRWQTSRKEKKDHGDGGTFIGSPIWEGAYVVIIDDVITSGDTKLEAIDSIKMFGGIPTGIVVAFDRQERTGALSVAQSLEQLTTCDIQVRAAATLTDLIDVLMDLSKNNRKYRRRLDKVLEYQARHCVS